MAANINGLIYYKLDANVHGFPGDITKNCGLRGEEIDGNFSFLRGHDIKSVSFDESGTMYLTRYNGEIISAKKTDTPEYDFNYNTETGSLTIVTPEGKEIVLSGFKVVTNVYHDYTLEGYGSQETPLEISNQGKTGRYRPAIKLIDMTAEDEDGKPLQLLPMENNTKHDRYVTKEKISRFGRLFPLSGVEKITKRLNDISSEWHVPTKEEWDEILNVIDCAKPEHNKTESNVDLGDFAGAALKATKYWNTLENGKMLSDDKFGFSIYPVGYCGNRGKEYYGSFGETSAFWTSTVEDNNRDMFVKTFDYNKETVGQRTWGENYYLSLRLVKKFDGNNFSDSESIDGFTSNCVHIPGTSLIWTKDNIAFSQEQYDGFTPKKWKEYENIEIDDNSYEIRYFVNDWNGNGWDKHELKEGEGIVLFEGENGRMHEWLLVDGELIDTSVLLKTEFQDEIDYIHNRIDTEISDRENVDSQLWEAIQNFTNEDAKIRTEFKTSDETIIKNYQDADVLLRTEFTASDNAITEAYKSADSQIISDYKSADEAIISSYQLSDAQLQNNIDTTNTKLDTEIEKCNTTIQNNLTESKTYTDNAVNTEKERSINAENELNTSILTEKSRAELAEQNLLSKVDINTQALRILNGDTTVDGSIKDIIFDSVLGTVVTTINIDDATEQSLIKKFTIDGIPYVYTSNSSSDMKHNGNALNTVIDSLRSDIDNTTNDTNKLKSDVDNLTTKVNENSTNINAINTNVEINKNDISVLKEDVKTLETNVNTLENEINNTINSLLAPMQATIASLQGELATVKAQLELANTNLTNTTNELNNTKVELQALKSSAITQIKGTENEIAVTTEGNTATVKFADDAYFVAGI